jgi:hypothetical protein
MDHDFPFNDLVIFASSFPPILSAGEVRSDTVQFHLPRGHFPATTSCARNTYCETAT